MQLFERFQQEKLKHSAGVLGWTDKGKLVFPKKWTVCLKNLFYMDENALKGNMLALTIKFGRDMSKQRKIVTKTMRKMNTLFLKKTNKYTVL